MRLLKYFAEGIPFLILIVSVFSPSVSSSFQLNEWSLQNPLPNNVYLYKSTFRRDVFVTVGSDGTILTSHDGISWEKRESRTREQLYAIAYGNGTFVTVGGSGTILTSRDGEKWTQRDSNTTERLDAIIYCKNIFAVVGTAGTILTSTDGITWHTRHSAPDKYGTFRHIAYGNGTFVAIGDMGGVMISSDGLKWDFIVKEFEDSRSGLFNIAYGNGTFVATGYGGLIISSKDGRTWTRRESWRKVGFSKLVYGNGVFAAVGNNGTVLTSGDGETWVVSNIGSTRWLIDLSYGDSSFVILRQGGKILTLPDSEITSESKPTLGKVIQKIISDNMPFVGDKGFADYYIDDLNGDGLPEIIIFAGEKRGEDVPFFNVAHIAIFTLTGGKEPYRKIATMSYGGTFVPPEIERAEDIDGDNVKEIFFATGERGATTDGVGILKLDLRTGKLDFLKIKNDNGEVVDAKFSVGASTMHSEDFFVKDSGKKGVKDLVEVRRVYEYEKPVEVGPNERVTEGSEEEEGLWTRCTVRAYEWNGSLYSYSERVSGAIVKDLGPECSRKFLGE